VIIDALGECIDLQDLLDVLTRLNDGRLRLFLTSRTEQLTEETFTGLPSISLNELIDSVEDDMQLHITTPSTFLKLNNLVQTKEAI
jgi:hypothetical protein